MTLANIYFQFYILTEKSICDDNIHISALMWRYSPPVCVKIHVLLFLNLSLLTFPVKINLLSLRSQNPCSSANLLSEISFSGLFTINHRHTSYLTVLLVKNLLLRSLDRIYVYLTQLNNGCFDSSLYFKSHYYCDFILHLTYYFNPSFNLSVK